MICERSNVGFETRRGCTRKMWESAITRSTAIRWYAADSRNRRQGNGLFTNTSAQNSAGAERSSRGDKRRGKSRSRRFPKKTRGRDGSSTSNRGAGKAVRISVTGVNTAISLHSRCEAVVQDSWEEHPVGPSDLRNPPVFLLRAGGGG